MFELLGEKQFLKPGRGAPRRAQNKCSNSHFISTTISTIKLRTGPRRSLTFPCFFLLTTYRESLVGAVGGFHQLRCNGRLKLLLEKYVEELAAVI